MQRIKTILNAFITFAPLLYLMAYTTYILLDRRNNVVKINVHMKS